MRKYSRTSVYWPLWWATSSFLQAFHFQTDWMFSIINPWCATASMPMQKLIQTTLWFADARSCADIDYPFNVTCVQQFYFFEANVHLILMWAFLVLLISGFVHIPDWQNPACYSKPVIFWRQYIIPLGTITEKHDVCWKLFADNTELNCAFHPDPTSALTAICTVDECCQDVKARMTANKLKLNNHFFFF